MGKFVIKQSQAGFSFSLKANNGEIVAIGGETFVTLRNCKNSIASLQKNAAIAPVEDQTVEGFKKEKCPKFEVYLDKAGEYRFRLKARNGEPIAASEGYVKKPSCLKGIESVRKNAADSPIIEPEAK